MAISEEGIDGTYDANIGRYHQFLPKLMSLESFLLKNKYQTAFRKSHSQKSFDGYLRRVDELEDCTIA